jgi:phage terminase Nu1 subunit (DNA packaging protein)
MSKPKRDKSLNEIAEALGVTQQMVSKYAARFSIPSDGSERRRRFNLDEFRQAMRDGGVGQTLSSRSMKADLGDAADDEGGEEITLAEANRRLTLERERTERLKNDVREGKLMDADEAERAWSAQLMTVRTAMEGVPVKAAQKIVAALQIPAEKVQAVRDILEASIRDAMRSLST